MCINREECKEKGGGDGREGKEGKRREEKRREEKRRAVIVSGPRYPQEGYISAPVIVELNESKKQILFVFVYFA